MKTILSESKKKVVINCFAFKNSDGEPAFILKYVNPIPTDETFTDKNGDVRQKWDYDHISSLFVNKKNLSSDLQKLEDSKICQEFKGKSIIVSTILTDE